MPAVPCTPVLLYHCWPTQRAESRQLAEFIWIDLAHVVMLVEHGTMSRDVGRKLLPAIREIGDAGVENLAIDPTKESLLYQIEAALAEKLGDYVAGAMHTARSRIDQRATVGRISLRNLLLQCMTRINEFRQVLITTAGKYESAVFPYHTHMQQSQPGNYAHYLLAYASKLQDDFERCRAAFARLNRSPLGTVGRCGTGISIDRRRTARLLGFDGCVGNSLLGKDAEYTADVMAALSMVMSHLNDLATDLQLWSSNEFAFISLPDTFCERSSLFPQKRNPVTLEAIKLAAGPSVSWYTNVLATSRSAGTGDHSLHGIPSNMEQALETTSDMLVLAGLSVEAVQLNGERIRHVLAESWSTASNLSDTLMQHHGLSMRQAYAVVSKVVSTCRERRMPKSAVTAELVREASLETVGKEVVMSQEDVHLALDPEAFVKTRISAGSVGPREVASLRSEAEELLMEDQAWVKEKWAGLVQARKDLDDAIQTILGSSE